MSHDTSAPRPADDELVRRARGGDEAALVEIYERHREAVFGYVLRLTGDRDLAGEIFCETFSTFFQHLEQYRPQGRLIAYLLTIARHKLANEQKARRRLGASLPAEDTQGALTAPAAAADESLISRELYARAQEALGELPADLREVVILRLFHDLDYQTIGKVVGAGEATVRSRMRYALQALRRLLAVDTDRN